MVRFEEIGGASESKGYWYAGEAKVGAEAEWPS